MQRSDLGKWYRFLKISEHKNFQLRLLYFGLPHSVVCYISLFVGLPLWTRVLKKLTDHKLVKEKSVRIVCNWKIRHFADKRSRSVPRTCQLSSLHAFLLHSFKMHFNIICLSTLQSMERYLLHVLKLKASTYSSSIRQDMFRPSHFP